MKSFNVIFYALILQILVLTNYSFPQGDGKFIISSNKPMPGEGINSDTDNYIINEIEQLEKEHKAAVESGNTEEAKRIEKEIYSLVPSEKIFITKSGQKEISPPENSEEPGDWILPNSTVISGSVLSDSLYIKKMEVKTGEDNNLYAVCVVYWLNGSVLYSQLNIMKSVNNGANWIQIKGAGFQGYISNVSMLVESRNNNNPDSTRIFAFYTISDYRSYLNSSLHYYSVLTNGAKPYFGLIASPSPGNKITYVSAVSDGYYFQNATYIGVICTESDNDNIFTQKLRYFRSINWGATWVNSDLITSYNDIHISADFKRGLSDSVYIAVERKFSSSSSQIRILATPFSPSASFRSIFLTNDVTAVYEKPCISIKQNTTVDSIILTSTKNQSPYYHFSYNGGGIWVIDNSLGMPAGSKTRFTYCSSYPDSEMPFAVCWQNEASDSLNLRKGNFGNFGMTFHRLNYSSSWKYVNPVCVTYSNSGNVFSGVIYFFLNLPTAGYFKFNGEGLKQLNVYVIPQGYYLNSSNLKYDDSISVFIRNKVSPYSIIDTVYSKLLKSGFISSYKFNSLPDNEYYIEVRHRNCIRVWSSSPVNMESAENVYYDFTQVQSSAFGNNQKKLQSSPDRFALYSGDVNQDDVIDGTDGLMIDNDASNFSQGRMATDLNGDEIIDGSDAVLADNNAANFITAIMP